MTTYITGTTTPGSALHRFLPDYLNILHHRGEQLTTTNKPGVDAAVLAHCTEHAVPLTVYAYRNNSCYRDVTTDARHIDVQTIEAPTWRRFRHLSTRTEKLVFLHSAKCRGAVNDLSTHEMLTMACDRRGLPVEQYIVQKQHTFSVNCTDLRAAPCTGAAHIYLYTRSIDSVADNRYFIGHYRIETWRQIGGVVQPGMGYRELVVPAISHHHALLALLKQALTVLASTPPYSLVIHSDRDLQTTLNQRRSSSPYADLKSELRTLLADYPLVTWQRETAATLRQQIGAHIQQQNELWYHRQHRASTKGLYA